MSDDDDRYICRLEMRKGSTYYDAHDIVSRLDDAGYRTEHSTTTGAVEVYKE